MSYPPSYRPPPAGYGGPPPARGYPGAPAGPGGGYPGPGGGYPRAPVPSSGGMGAGGAGAGHARGFDMSKKVKLWEGPSERRKVDTLGELYVTFKTTEHLESMFISDNCKAEEYTEHCYRLIAQFQTLESTLRDAGHVRDVNQFIQQHGLGNCHHAKKRLLVEKVPITVKHSAADSRGATVNVAETVQNFITAMDSLKLDIRAVDDIQPLLNDVVNSLNRHTGDDEGLRATKMKLSEWLVTLNKMRASDELDEDQARELAHQLERGYNAFHKSLQTGGA